MTDIILPSSGDAVPEKKEKKKKKKTVGEASLELSQKKQEKVEAVELQREMLKGYTDSLVETAKSVDWDKPYYVCVQARKERLLENVIRNQFYARKTRPIPNYDLSLYYYDPKKEQLQFVWTIPDPDTCMWLMMNRDKLGPDHDQLIWFVERFSEGSLI